jgi:hypothetical protein
MGPALKARLEVGHYGGTTSVPKGPARKGHENEEAQPAANTECIFIERARFLSPNLRQFISAAPACKTKGKALLDASGSSGLWPGSRSAVQDPWSANGNAAGAWAPLSLSHLTNDEFWCHIDEHAVRSEISRRPA